MNERQLRAALAANNINEDEIEDEIDRWADDKTRMREEMEYMEKQDAA